MSPPLSGLLVVALEQAVAAPMCTCRLAAAAARGADAIVMATEGRTGLTHLLIGSVAEKVVRHAPVPVLVLRAGARTGRRRRS